MAKIYLSDWFSVLKCEGSKELVLGTHWLYSYNMPHTLLINREIQINNGDDDDDDDSDCNSSFHY